MSPPRWCVECCDLDVSRKLSSPIINAYGLNRGWRCRKCNEHRGKPIQMAQDHEDDLRVRWGQTVDDWHAAEDRADTGRDKMLAAFKCRDNVVRQFEKLSRYHHPTDHGCICGKRNCETLNIVDADWINDHIARMHEREAM